MGREGKQTVIQIGTVNRIVSVASFSSFLDLVNNRMSPKKRDYANVDGSKSKT